MRFFTLLSCLLLWGAGLTAQTPTQLVDIFPGDSGAPRNFFRFGDQTLFVAETELEGAELWITDGTAANTRLLKDINTDPADARGNSLANNFVEFEGKVYFSARSAGIGLELWVTDGTEEGTQLVKDIQEGEGNGAPRDFLVFNDRLWFTATDAATSSELWVTDGTEEGTEMFLDINPDGPSNPNFKTQFLNLMVFTANNGENGNEIWVSDGTVDGTLMLFDTRPGPDSGSPSQYFGFNNLLLFRTDDGVNGREVWSWNANTNIIGLVFDLRPGEEGSAPSDFFSIGPTVFFTADHDDVEGENMHALNFGTGQIFVSILNQTGPSNPGEIVEVSANRGYMTTVDTGAVAGQTEFLFINSLASPLAFDFVDNRRSEFATADPDDLLFTGSSLYFTYETPETGRELAGFPIFTNEGAVAFGEVVPGATGGDIDDLNLLGNQLLFEADNGTDGRELWTADVSVADIRLTTEDGTVVSDLDTVSFGDIGVNLLDSVVVDFNNSGNANGILLSLQFAQDTEASAFELRGAPVDNFNLLPPTPNNADMLISVLPQEVGPILDTVLATFITATGEQRIFFLVDGNVLAPELAVSEGGATIVSGGNLSFENLTFGTDSTKMVTITNNGEGDLGLFSRSFATGTVFSASEVDDTLAMGESLSLMVTFNDPAGATSMDVLTIETSIGDFLVNLSGSYGAPEPVLAVSEGTESLLTGATLNFDDVPENTDSTRTLTIANSGSAELMITSVRLADSTVFSVSEIASTIAVGGSVDADITYSPTEISSATDVLTITTNAGDFVVNLSGVSIVNSVVSQGIPVNAVYPNPTSDVVRLELKEALVDGDWRITDLTGKIVRTGVWPNGQFAHDLDFSNLVAGTYTVELVSGTNRLTARIIKL